MAGWPARKSGQPVIVTSVLCGKFVDSIEAL